MVIARDDEYAAVRRAPVSVTVFERITCAIHAGAFAVPHRENAIDGPRRVRLDLLRAEDRGRGQVLVDGRQELDVVFFEKRLRAPQFLVDRAEWRAAITADETGRVQSGRPVKRCLHERDAHERLRAGQEHAARLAAVAVEQLVVIEGVVWNRICGNGHPDI